MAILVIEAKRTRAAEKHVRERIGTNNCVACDADVCKHCAQKVDMCSCENFEADIRQHRRRGHCPRCERRWEAERDQFPTEQAKAEFDAELIRRGLLLAEYEISKLTRVGNSFEEVAREMVSKG